MKDPGNRSTKVYDLSVGTVANGASVILTDERGDDQQADFIGEGDIVVRINGGKIIVDGSKLKGRRFLGEIDPDVDNLGTIEQNPDENDYYRFSKDGLWESTEQVYYGDELYL